MSSRRFMINTSCISNGTATLGGELFRHIVRVLRLTAEEQLTLVDETGSEHEGVIDQVTRDLVTVRITRSLHEPPQECDDLRITVCQALPKGEKIDLILQKGTELGAFDFWLFGGCRSVARVREDQLAGKLERWNRITAEASRQCGRRSIPAVRWFPGATEAAAAATHDLRLLLWEEEHTRSLKEAISASSTSGSVIAAIGPEGGFEALEKNLFANHGFLTVSMGSRILRTETAAIAIVAILQYTGGDI